MAAEAQISAKHIELNGKRKLEEKRKRNILCVLVWLGREVYGEKQNWIEKRKTEAQA